VENAEPLQYNFSIIAKIEKEHYDAIFNIQYSEHVEESIDANNPDDQK
jgi:hypothetical protein